VGQVVQVNGDYKIKTGEGNDILLDTGFKVGNVIVTGNLVVEGDTLTVQAQNLNVQDNIITLNFGEIGPGVTLVYSGIQVDRGTLSGVIGADPLSPPPASLTFDEASDAWQISYGTPESNFNFNNSRLRVQQILTDNDTELGATGRNGDLLLLGTGSPGVITVKGTSTTGIPYSSRVVDDDDIPNKRYVDDAIQLNPTFQIVRDNTRVVAFDNQISLDPGVFPIGPIPSQPAENQIAVIVDNDIQAVFYRNRLEYKGLTIYNEDPVPGFNILPGDVPNAVVIQATNTNANIKLETTGTGKVEITYALQLDNLGISPSINSGNLRSNSSALYGGPVGSGTTGIYSLNQQYRDELVNKNRAILFSMLF
jgi:hypothetical protein